MHPTETYPGVVAPPLDDVPPVPAVERSGRAVRLAARTAALHARWPAPALLLARVAVAALAAEAFLAALMTLWWPLGWDQATFSYIGGAILDGGVPYRDLFEMRGPAVLYLHAGIVAVFGRHAASVRVFDFLVLVGFAVLFWRMLRPFASRTAVVLALSLWTLQVVTRGAHHVGQPDQWVGYAALAAVALGARPGGARLRDLAVAGALVAFCALSKPFYLGYLAAVAAPVIVERGWRPRALAGPLAVLALGCAVPIAVMFGALAVQGAIPAFMDAQVWYNLRVYGHYAELSLGGLVRGIIDYLVTAPAVALVVPAAGVGLATLARRSRPLAAGVAVMLFMSFVGLALQRKLYFYHWFPVYTGLAFLSAIGVTTTVADVRGLGRGPDAAAPVPSSGFASPARAFFAAYLASLVLAVALPPTAELHRWEWYLTGRKTRSQYYTEFAGGWLLNPDDQMRMAVFLQTHTPPGTPVAIWGPDCAVPFLAHRPMVGRFAVPSWLLTFKKTAPMVQGFRREYVDALRTTRPPYILRSVFEEVREQKPTPLLSDAEVLPELGSFVERNYVYEGRNGDFDVYRRADYRPTSR